MKKFFHAILPAAVALLAFGCGRDGRPEKSEKSERDVVYDEHFSAERLRLDLVFCGDKKTQSAYLKEMHREQTWSGSPESLIDDFGYGEYCYKLYDKGKLVFSSGFCSLFDEWRTTAQAEELPMASCQSLWMPFPRNKVHFVLYQRMRKNGRFRTMLEFDIDPEDRHIIPGPDNNWPVRALRYTGDSPHKVDLVFVGEGYTSSEMHKLYEDSERICEYIFSMEPYASRKKDFNVWLVESASEQSGADIPQNGIWKRTVMDSMFDTFYIDRYLTVMDQTKIASAVSGTPADAVFVVVNSSKYGGAGIYRSYAMGTSDNTRSLPVTIHEFGHSFAGLGDEYYDSETAYENFYPKGVEPWEPNVTTNADFASKWEDMIEPGTPVPTPNDSCYAGMVGLFEGAGYVSKGCYRPYFECRMLNNTAPGFCPVCQRAINRMIDFYTR